MSFTSSKNTHEPVPTSPIFFSIKSPSGTDLYRKPPSHDIANVPMFYKCYPINSFYSARVTIKSAAWTRLFDQGGLVVMLPHKSPVKWVKTGIEVNDGYLNVSSVSADRFADWSLLPLSEEDGRAKHTIEIERKKTSLKIYLVDEGIRKLVRSVTWFFEDAEEGQNLLIGCYVARPTQKGEDQDELEVYFENFEVQLMEEEVKTSHD